MPARTLGGPSVLASGTSTTLEMRAQRWRDGRLEADETHTLEACVYFRGDVLEMLGKAGFGPVEVSRGYGGARW